MSTLTQGAVGWLIGRASRTVREIHAPGNPKEDEDDDITYNASVIFKWALEKQNTGQELTDGESKSEAERRLKIAQADIKEIERAERRGDVVAMELVDGVLTTQEVMLRNLGENLERAFGPSCLQMYNGILQRVAEKSRAFIDDCCDQQHDDDLEAPGTSTESGALLGSSGTETTDTDDS